MSALSFEKDVKCIFSKYVADMDRIQLASPSGTRVLQLGNYESVKLFYYEIQVAIHGYDFDNEGKQRVANNQLLPVRDGLPGEFVKSAPHPMPINGPLPQEGIAIYDQWVRDGMLP